MGTFKVNILTSHNFMAQYYDFESQIMTFCIIDFKSKIAVKLTLKLLIMIFNLNCYDFCMF